MAHPRNLSGIEIVDDEVETVDTSERKSCDVKGAMQTVGGTVLNAWESFTPVPFFSQIIPVSQIPAPYNIVVSFAGMPVNYVTGKIFKALFTKEDPSSSLTASGGGNACTGFLKESSTTLIGLAAAAGVGYGTAIFIDRFGDDGYLHDDLIKMAVFSFSGYWAFQYVKFLGTNALDCCVPRQEEAMNAYPKLNWVQIAGQYGMRYFASMTSLETILLCARHSFGNETLADPRTQIVLLLTVDAFLNMSRRLSFIPHPFGSLVLHENSTHLDTEAQQEVKTRPSSWQTLAATIEAILIDGFFLSVGCGVTEMIRWGRPEAFQQDNLASRMERDGYALGIALGAKYVVTEVLPRISKCCHSLFNRRQGTASEEKPLLAPAPGR